MSIYGNAVKRPITTIMIFVALMVMGGYSLNELPIDLYPDIDFPAISVITTYSGASAADIETNKQNYTRFLVLGNKDENHVNESDKSSVRVILSHTPGSLSKALHVLHEYGLNLTKIQSVPIIGKPYEYAIHFDIEYSDYLIYKAAMDKIGAVARELQILGVYKKGAAPILV